MLKKISAALGLFIFGFIGRAHSQCYEVSISTCIGDFGNGGDYESGSRLIGNASWYSFGILQGNLVRVFISSGKTDPPSYDAQTSTPTRAGYVGVWVDGVSQFPSYVFDVWGTMRSTDSAYLATSTGSVVIGSTRPAGVNGALIVVSTQAMIRDRGLFIGTVTFSGGTSDPAGVNDGTLHFRSDLGTLRLRAGGSWITLSTITGADFITASSVSVTYANRGGARFTGNVSVDAGGTHTLTVFNMVDVAGAEFSSLTIRSTDAGGTRLRIYSQSFAGIHPSYIVKENAGGGSGTLYIRNDSGGAVQVDDDLQITGTLIALTSFTADGHVIASSFTSKGTVTSTTGFVGEGGKLSNTISVANAGATVGLGRAINFTGNAVSNVTQSGSTFTVTLSASDTLPKIYKVVLGTLTAVGVDIASNTVDGIIEAVSRLSGSSGTIVIKEGLYSWTGATCPAGVRFEAAGSSCVVRTSTVGTPVISIYGEVHGLTFDFGGQGVVSQMIRMGNGGRLYGVKLVGGHNMATGGSPNSSLISVYGSSNVRVNAEVYDTSSRCGAVLRGDANPFLTRDAHDVIWELDVKGIYRQSCGGEGSMFGVINSSEVVLQDSHFARCGAECITVNSGSGRVWIRNNHLKVTNSPSGKGYVTFDDTAVDLTTGHVVMGNRFYLADGNAASTNLITMVGVTPGARVKDNLVIGESLTATFLEIEAASAINVVVEGNTVDGISSFISDSGTGTKYTGNDNFLNGIEQ